MVGLNVSDKLFPPAEPIEGLEGEELEEAVKAWFLSNFEDPAERTPYVSAEGGYQWIWGGPYDAREEIESYFGDQLSPSVVDAVVADLESTAVDWAPSDSRIYEEEEADESGGGTEASVPELPQQGYGPHFEIGEDGVVRFAPPGTLDARGNNVDRLRRMLPSLRELSGGLVEELNKGNSPHHQLLARASAYFDLINQDIQQIDFSMLYIAGVRLANAEKAASGDTDLPPLGVSAGEAVESLLQVHGSFILSSADGVEALAAEERYNRTRLEEIEYREAAIDFAQQLQNQPEIVDPKVASAVLNAVEEIGKGANIDRSGTVATGILSNVTITLSIAASLGALTAGAVATGSLPLMAVAGAAVLVATEGLKKSKPFAALAAFVTDKIDSTSKVDLSGAVDAVRARFDRQFHFFRAVGPQLKRIASTNHQSFRWLDQTTRWLDQQADRHGSSPSSGGVVSEVSIEHILPPLRQGIEGNIYLAKVGRVEQSLNAAFVDYGDERNGFLAFSDIHPDYFQIPVEERRALYIQQASDLRDLDARAGASNADEHELNIARESVARLRPYVGHYNLRDVIKRRQVMLVQVRQDPRGDRGARLTTYLSLSGRYVVLLPNTALGAVVGSQFEPSERLRLTDIIRQLEVPEGMGLILRPSSNLRTEFDIRTDFNSLLRGWESVRDDVLKMQAPALAYEAVNPPFSG